MRNRHSVFVFRQFIIHKNGLGMVYVYKRGVGLVGSMAAIDGRTATIVTAYCRFCC